MLARSLEEESIQKLLAEKEMTHPKLLQAIALYKKKFKPLENGHNQPGSHDAYSQFLELMSANSSTIDEFLKIDAKFTELFAQEKIVANRLAALDKATEALKLLVEAKETDALQREKRKIMMQAYDSAQKECENLKSMLPIPACEAFKSKLQAIVTKLTSLTPVNRIIDDFSEFQKHIVTTYSLMLQEIDIFCVLAKKCKSLLRNTQDQRNTLATKSSNLLDRMTKESHEQAEAYRKSAEAHEKSAEAHEKSAEAHEKSAEAHEKSAAQHMRNAINAYVEQYEIAVAALDKLIAIKTENIDIREQETARGLRKLFSDLPPLPAIYEAKRQFVLREIDNFINLHTDKRSIPDLLSKMNPVFKELNQFVNPKSSEYVQVRRQLAASEEKEEKKQNIKLGTTAKINAQLSIPSHHSQSSNNKNSPLTQAKDQKVPQQVSVVPHILHKSVIEVKQGTNHFNDQEKCSNCVIM